MSKCYAVYSQDTRPRIEGTELVAVYRTREAADKAAEKRATEFERTWVRETEFYDR